MVVTSGSIRITQNEKRGRIDVIVTISISCRPHLDLPFDVYSTVNINQVSLDKFRMVNQINLVIT